MCLRDKHAIIQHVHVWSSRQNRTCHPLLILCENEIRNSSFGVVVSPVILLVPVGVLDRIVGRSVDVVLYLLVSCDLVRSDAVEELALFSYSKAICVHPGPPHPIESSVQVLLTVLAALNKADVRQFGNVLCAFGGDVAGEHSGGVTTAVGESF